MVSTAVPWVIDGHTHAFPTAWVADRSAHVRADFWFGELYEAPSARMIDASMLLMAMDAAGVAQAVMCGWPWADPAHCREHNDYMAEAAIASGGRLAWLGTVSPTAPGAAREAARCLDLGACGIGELNADAQGFELAPGGGLGEVVAVLIAANRPLLLHASEPVGHRYPGKGTATPERLLPFIAEHQELSIVLAHWGGGLPFYALMSEVAELTQSVAYDTAASSYLYRPAVFRTVLDLVGRERVIWGSDHPVLGMERFLRRTQRLPDLRDDELVSLLHGNAQRIYGLAAPASFADAMSGATGVPA